MILTFDVKVVQFNIMHANQLYGFTSRPEKKDTKEKNGDHNFLAS